MTRFSFERSNGTHFTPLMSDFNDFIPSCSLHDFSPNNFSYMWTNFHQKVTLVKLDRFLVSINWESHYPASVCSGKSRIVSDHLPIYLNTRPPGWGPLSDFIEPDCYGKDSMP